MNWNLAPIAGLQQTAEIGDNGGRKTGHLHWLSRWVQCWEWDWVEGTARRLCDNGIRVNRLTWKGIAKMKKGIVAGVLCVLFSVFCCVGGCERKSRTQRIRELEENVQCASQLSHIGMTIALYLNDYDDSMPPDLETLIEREYLDVAAAICPCADDQDGQGYYVYRGADLTDANPSEMIVAHDRQGRHGDGVRNVLHLGYDVSRMSELEFANAIERDNEMRRKLGLQEKPLE